MTVKRPFVIFLTSAFILWGGGSPLSGNEERRSTPTRPSAIKVSPETRVAAKSGEAEERQSANKEGTRFGPYKTLTFDEDILQEVVYRKSDNTVWLRLRPEKRNREIVVKISNMKFDGYRKWFTTDDYELVSPANAGKQPNALSDWLTTRARFIEYYMDGELFLHLERVE